MQDDGRSHAGAAVRDELTGREVGDRLVPGCVERARNPTGFLVDRVRLAAPTRRQACIHDDELLATACQLLGVDRVVSARARRELHTLNFLLAARERPMPPVEVHHGAGVVTEVAEQPPQALGAAHVPVGDDEDPGADACASRSLRELFRLRQRVAAARAGLGGEVRVDVQEARTRNVALEIELASAPGVAELPAAVDELVAQTYQLPAADAGSGTDAGWIT